MHTYIKFYSASKFGTIQAAGQHILNPTQDELDNAIAVGERDSFDTLHIYCDRWFDLKAWTTPGSYSGPQYYGFVGVAGTNRDADTLTQCNYDRIREDLKDELKNEGFTNEGGDQQPVVETASASHWACGWVKTVMVHYSSVKALDLVASILSALRDYPVYDDSAFSEAEHEKKNEYFESWAKGEMGRELTRLFGERWTETVTESKAWNEAALAIWDELCSYSGVEDAYPNERRLRAVLCCSHQGPSSDITWRLKDDIKALYLVKRIASAFGRLSAQARA